MSRAKKIIDTLIFWFECARGYSIPITILSWCIPFLFAIAKKGNILYGLLALIGIVLTHLGVNLFDDVIDYSIEKRKISKGLQDGFNFQKCKCGYILNNSASVKKTLLVSFTLFAIASIIGIFLTCKCGIVVIFIMLCTAVLGLLYPLLSHIGLGELTVGIIYAPMLYLGTYYVMKQSFSAEIMIISISTGLLVVGLLHTHTLMDYELDVNANKKTICSMSGSKKNAVIIQGIIMMAAYANIIIFIHLGYLPQIMLLVLFSIPTSLSLYKTLDTHIKTPEKNLEKTIWMGPMGNLNKIEDKSTRNFMLKFFLARNVMVVFTIFLCIAKIISIMK